MDPHMFLLAKLMNSHILCRETAPREEVPPRASRVTLLTRSGDCTCQRVHGKACSRSTSYEGVKVAEIMNYLKSLI